MIEFRDLEKNDTVFPVVLIVHANVSMGGTPIKNINENLATFLENLSAYNLTHGKVELCVITVTDEAKCIHEWETISENPIVLPTIFAEGDADLSKAFDLALGRINSKCMEYELAKISYHKPAIVLISDDTSMTDRSIEAAVKSKVANDELNLFLLLVNDDVAPEFCDGKNAYTVDFDDPYYFSGFFKLIENAIKGTVPYTASDKIDYTDLLDEIWENLHIKKIY